MSHKEAMQKEDGKGGGRDHAQSPETPTHRDRRAGDENTAEKKDSSGETLSFCANERTHAFRRFRRFGVSAFRAVSLNKPRSGTAALRDCVEERPICRGGSRLSAVPWLGNARGQGRAEGPTWATVRILAGPPGERVGGSKKSGIEKEVEEEKEEEKTRGKTDKTREDSVPSGASRKLNRAGLSRKVPELQSRAVGAGPGAREREREREERERGLAAWVVQMGGTRHK
ncbi:hypothetical protein EYF80_055395 [Liparis tanakae]|uniref:Uncharacterized protein n=1 Tax=Liparis tanakae TaxID=230148 RepID=A0A4Z2F097_9TELE|nr:hypothetical protein EYF80_055395 [Liparis tanakae]